MAYFRSFFQRFGAQGICVLPAEVLSNDPLRVDPQTHTMPSSLRQQASALGLCFARILRSCGDGLYWAFVASTPDLVDAQRVVLTEEQLYHALPWDIRLVDRQPGAIRDLMFAHAQAVRPAQPLVEDVRAQDIRQLHPLTPAPIVPLHPLEEAVVVVTTDELHEAFEPRSPEDDDDVPGAGLLPRLGQKTRKQLALVKAIGSFAMQQALLRAMVDALMSRLYQAQDHLAAHILKVRCALLAQIQRWHCANRQRVVNAVPVWNDERQQIVWQLTVGVPLAVSAVV
jgi:hypothetical protein